MSSSAGDRKRIERRKTAMTVVLILVLLAGVVGLVIWTTSFFGLSSENLKNIPVLMAFLDSESSQPLMGSLCECC